MFEKRFEEYEKLNFEDVHSSILPYLAQLSGTIVDIGSGSGRDAAGLAEMGFNVIAIEPSHKLLEQAKSRHQSPNIKWLHGALPNIPNSLKNTSNDAVLLSAVWTYIRPDQRGEAMLSMSGMLKEGGYLFLSYRNKISSDCDQFYEATIEETSRCALAANLHFVKSFEEYDHMKRDNIYWNVLVYVKQISAKPNL
ncbi:class I SAM-dependent methyltransferase [Emcibacter sp.]|uniref:class I SAM-dependent methyltransferase n=1 Tax=Emcibacter sp. TaxID=1979954 RepID=UPI002AA8215C|nr:class I SAM-dependent methyltransferase [Emcibacter sp.]